MKKRKGTSGRDYCSYCGGDFRCGECGKLYVECKCKVYQSMHVECPIRHRMPRKRAVIEV